MILFQNRRTLACVYFHTNTGAAVKSPLGHFNCLDYVTHDAPRYLYFRLGTCSAQFCTDERCVGGVGGLTFFLAFVCVLTLCACLSCEYYKMRVIIV